MRSAFALLALTLLLAPTAAASAPDAAVDARQAVGLVTGVLPPATTSSTSCGGTAPLQITCSSSGTVGTSLTAQCASTLAFTGYINVAVSSSTSTFTFTCYFASGVFIAKSTPVQTGTFVSGQSYSLSGAGVGVGGWSVSVFS
jgi:hypothetical protein